MRIFSVTAEPSNEPLTAEEVIQAKRQARRRRVPHTRADLINKIEMLRIAENDDEADDDGDTDEENTDSEYDYDYDSDDVESVEDEP